MLCPRFDVSLVVFFEEAACEALLYGERAALAGVVEKARWGWELWRHLRAPEALRAEIIVATGCRVTPSMPCSTDRLSANEVFWSAETLLKCLNMF